MYKNMLNNKSEKTKNWEQVDQLHPVYPIVTLPKETTEKGQSLCRHAINK